MTKYEFTYYVWLVISYNLLTRNNTGDMLIIIFGPPAAQSL